MIRRLVMVSLSLALLIAACGDQNPTPAGDPPILGGFESLPKQLVTIAITPTPTPVIVGEQAVQMAAVGPATPTPGPKPPTPTLTPYVGIFLGEPTSESGEPAPTLAPFVVNPVQNGGAPAVPQQNTSPGGCAQVATAFANAYNSNAALQQQLGCAVNSGIAIGGMATQPFERGNMFWRSDTQQIYALANNGQFWQAADAWNESLPVDDPAFAAPNSTVLQPVRGFGFLWRNNPSLRDALGWATMPEAQYNSFWQDFENGAMFVGNNNLVYALFPAEGRHSGPLQ